MVDSTDDRLRSVVDSTGREIEAAVAGSLYEIDDERVIIHDVEVWKREKWEAAREKYLGGHPDLAELAEKDPDGFDEMVEDEIGTPDDVDDPEPVSLGDLLSDDSLGDLRFEVSSRRELLGGKTLVAFGGPNVWVSDDCVRGYWGFDEKAYNFDDRTRNELWEWFKEQYEMAFA